MSVLLPMAYQALPDLIYRKNESAKIKSHEFLHLPAARTPHTIYALAAY